MDVCGDLSNARQRVTHEPGLRLALRLCVQVLELAAAAPVARIVHARRVAAIGTGGAQRKDASASVASTRLELDVYDIPWGRARDENGEPVTAADAVSACRQGFDA
jgi:hypothetical protein